MSAGQDTDQDRSVVRRWRRTLSAQWLPRSRAQLADSTAAALSQLHHPRTWRDVTVARVAGGRYMLTVRYRRGYPQSVLIGSYSELQDIARLFNVHTRIGHASKSDRTRLKREWRNVHFDVEMPGGPYGKARVA